MCREVQCKQYHEECKKLSQMFVACFQDCKYPQHLQEIDPSKQGSAIKSCKDLQAQLSALEQSGSPLHENQVPSSRFRFMSLSMPSSLEVKRPHQRKYLTILSLIHFILSTSHAVNHHPHPNRE